MGKLVEAYLCVVSASIAGNMYSLLCLFLYVLSRMLTNQTYKNLAYKSEKGLFQAWTIKEIKNTFTAN